LARNARKARAYRGNLDPGEHAAVVRALVAAVEEADVPVLTHAVEEAHERSRALRKLEPIQHLVLGARGAAADEVAYVQLRHLVVAQVERTDPVSFERAGETLGLESPAHFEADEDVRIGRAGVG
jgi:hypothetical protein